MKLTNLMTSTLVLLFSLTALAEGTDFNSVIEESMRAENDLRVELQAKFKAPKLKKTKSAQEFKEIAIATIGKPQAEDVPVISSRMRQPHQKRMASSKTFKSVQQRISQEFKEARN